MKSARAAGASRNVSRAAARRAVVRIIMDSFRTTGEGKAVLQWHASGHGGPLLPAPRHRATVTNQPRRSLFSAVDASELAWQRIAAFDGRDPIATLKCTVHVGIVPANIIPS